MRRLTSITFARPATQQITPGDKIERARDMRQAPTRYEIMLAGVIRRVVGTRWKVEPQRILCGYIADFCLPELKLVLEADGAQHREQQEYDATRDMAMQRAGYHVLRFEGRLLDRSLRDAERILRGVIAARERHLHKQA